MTNYEKRAIAKEQGIAEEAQESAQIHLFEVWAKGQVIHYLWLTEAQAADLADAHPDRKYIRFDK